ncbi:uncharacterized protein [Henckelia pumila]|uniref:uncharacterized protein isoform X1 n=1 Tax=Henckelia pumila TaxID=405737 RepID=UPI003C6E7B9D
MTRSNSEAQSYFSKDFEWDRVKEEVESDPSLRFHLLPYSSEDTATQNHDSEAWENFHSRHSTGKFFKERRYLLKEFPELASCEGDSKVLEVGCGNGSTVLPILRGQESVSVYACDCSNEALERAKVVIGSTNSISNKSRFCPFQCDFSTFGFPSWLACESCSRSFPQTCKFGFPGASSSNKINGLNPSNFGENKRCIGGVDFITMIFTLSAIPFHGMPKAIAHCFPVLKPGGLILFRDYGLYDMTMLRFKPEQRVGYREYMRSDGTRSYFFSLDAVRNLTSAAGFIEVELEYCCVKSVNRRNGKVMKRVWVHGKFQKPKWS